MRITIEKYLENGLFSEVGNGFNEFLSENQCKQTSLDGSRTKI